MRRYVPVQLRSPVVVLRRVLCAAVSTRPGAHHRSVAMRFASLVVAKRLAVTEGLLFEKSGGR